MITNRGKKIPIGIENFEEICTEGFYYVDKTGLIGELLRHGGKVNLFTRPRRFGKSLNMSMLKNFFEIGCNREIFANLQISEEKALCEEYMGKFPVISVSLKGINGNTFEMARDMAVQMINKEARRLQYLLDSCSLTSHDKEAFSSLLSRDMDEAVICSSLQILSELLQKHYGEKVIILIDEYDVPLAKAFENGYYEQMVSLIRNLFEQTLKTNDSLYLAVLTGCMRIAKESIFTGLNNLNVLSVSDVEFDEYFGFTDKEVRELLEYYNLSESYDTVKNWYDGYHFGNVDVYCPWDVICYCSKLCVDKKAQPRDFWSNTSSNDIVKRIIEKADTGTTKWEIERLVAGEAIRKEIHQELTYKELYDSIDNIWSVLYTTGYLTQRGRPDGDIFQLVIPNLEIRKIFTKQIIEWFKDTVKQDGQALNAFCEALKGGNAAEVERQFEGYLRKTISIRDTFVRKPMKENFYHGILLGLLGFKENWGVFSNKESGEGYSDIQVIIDDEEIGIVIEVKYPDSSDLEAGSREALLQIEKNSYDRKLREEGMRVILKYGIACYKSRCKVMVAKEG